VAGAAAAAAGAAEELQDRFAGRLRFGTAGLRGAVAAGPNRMNRAVVRAATAAVADWLLASVHLTSQLTLRTAEPAKVMSLLRADPPVEFGGEPVVGMADLSDGQQSSRGTNAPGAPIPVADVLIFRLPGARVVLRPSGTEPKIKCYIEIVEPLAGRSLVAARQAAAERLAPVRSALQAVLAEA
jgi:phosphomannomutase